MSEMNVVFQDSQAAKIRKLANEEKRSYSNMARVLVDEALDWRQAKLDQTEAETA